MHMGAQEGGRGGIIVERDNRGEYHMGNMTLHARERSLRLQGGRGRRGGAGGDVGRKWDPLGGGGNTGDGAAERRDEREATAVYTGAIGEGGGHSGGAKNGGGKDYWEGKIEVGSDRGFESRRGVGSAGGVNSIGGVGSTGGNDLAVGVGLDGGFRSAGGVGLDGRVNLTGGVKSTGGVNLNGAVGSD